MAGALLVPHQNVLDVALLENLVIDRKHRAAGIAEQMLDAMIDEGAHDHRGAGHLVRIVALIGHDVFLTYFSAWSGCAVLARLGRVEFWEIKKGPRGPHAHRLNLDGLSHPRRCAW